MHLIHSISIGKLSLKIKIAKIAKIERFIVE